MFSPSAGSASRHESSFQQAHSNQAASPQIVYAAAPSGASHSSRFSERYQSQLAAAPQTVAVPIYPSGGSSRYTSHNENYSNQGLSGGIVPIVSYPSSNSLSSRLSEESSSANSNFGSGVTGFTYPNAGFDSSAHQFNTRFGDYAASSGLCK